MKRKLAENVLITGASSGIGAAVAAECAKRGARNLFEQALAKQADRIASRGTFSKEDLVTLTAEDIPA